MASHKKLYPDKIHFSIFLGLENCLSNKEIHWKQEYLLNLLNNGYFGFFLFEIKLKTSFGVSTEHFY